MKSYVFYPELLANRADAAQALADASFDLLIDYQSIKALPDLHGVEVEGIANKQTAMEILSALKKRFPDWGWERISFKDLGAKPGWQARLSRYRERGGDSQ